MYFKIYLHIFSIKYFQEHERIKVNLRDCNVRHLSCIACLLRSCHKGGKHSVYLQPSPTRRRLALQQQTMPKEKEYTVLMVLGVTSRSPEKTCTKYVFQAAGFLSPVTTAVHTFRAPNYAEFELSFFFVQYHHGIGTFGLQKMPRCTAQSA